MKSFLETLRKLWADPMGKIGMIGVFLLIAMAIFAPMPTAITPTWMDTCAP